MTNDLQRRIFEHRTGKDPDSFACRYQCWTLVHFDAFTYVNQAIAREKQLKNWTRVWKDALVEQENPTWSDLSISWDYRGWFDPKNPPQGFYTQNAEELWGGPERQLGSSDSGPPVLRAIAALVKHSSSEGKAIYRAQHLVVSSAKGYVSFCSVPFDRTANPSIGPS